jgi:hypothetical protein
MAAGSGPPPARAGRTTGLAADNKTLFLNAQASLLLDTAAIDLAGGGLLAVITPVRVASAGPRGRASPGPPAYPGNRPRPGRG